MAPVIADPQRNAELAARAIRESVRDGASVIVLPELMTTGYHLTVAETSELAESPTGASIASWVAALSGSESIVVGGFCERGDDGVIYNSAAMVSGDGVMAVYRKTHLWDKEHRLFTPGDSPPPVINTRWGPVGVAICYDLFFPEVVRTLALSGARLLTVPTNSPTDEVRPAAAPSVDNGIGHAIARTGAYLNRVYIAVCDRHGDERGHSWTARSSIVGPEGDFLAGPVSYSEQFVVADCDLALADTKQWEGTTNDAFADRRPGLYGRLIST